DPWGAGAVPAQRRVRVGFAAPQVVDAGDDQPTAGAVVPDRLVAQYPHTLGPQRVGDRPVQFRVPPHPAGVVDSEVGAAEHRVDPERGPEVAEGLRGLLDVPGSAIDEVAGQRDQVRLLGQGPFEGALDVTGRDLAAVVEVGQVGDLEPAEGGGQVAD